MKHCLPAAERTWFAVAPDGTEHMLVIRVDAPATQPGGEWAATASLGILDSRPYKIAGIHAWQATGLAMKFVATRVEHFAKDGWRFYWERDGDVAQPSELAVGQ